MVTITRHCPHCQSDALVRNGHAPSGKQLYRRVFVRTLSGMVAVSAS